MLRLDALAEPRGSAYRSLVGLAKDRGCQGLLVVRSGARLGERGESLLDQLRPSIRSEAQAQEWPGTRTLDQHLVLTFELNDVTTTLLARTVSGLFGWRQPELPEDLCFLDSDGEVWLTSVAHESLAWVVAADEAEAAALRNLGFAGR